MPMARWVHGWYITTYCPTMARCCVLKRPSGARIGAYDGVIEVTVTIRDNQPEKVTISGTAVILFHAEWVIEI